MDDTGQKVCLWKLKTFLLIYSIFGIVKGDIIIQDDANCGSLRYPMEHSLNDRNEDLITSHIGNYYLPSKDCVISILGKTNYQFEVSIEFLEVDSKAIIDPVTQEPIKCFDYLKIYDSPRVDHAKLMTSPAGLCGTGNLPQKRIFTTSCPFLALEFVTDSTYETMKGFNLKVIQYPWRNPGNIYPGAGLVPGASWSCYYSEFQPGWDFQGDSLPGNINPGGDKDWDKDYTGIYCYTCESCPVDYFTPDSYKGSSYGSCFRCAKMFDISRGDAKRRCYGQNDYLELIESFQDTQLDPNGYLGCRDFVNEYNAVTKYCFCDTDNCNTAQVHRVFTPILFLLTFASSIFQYCT